ncbi:hypothetical protein [Psychrobacillus sp. FSL H8-0487]|uniref:hypothetical protein n=1 Tax=Psychrobacillus sp. FSL H8-0487 TaxID=2921391 RepID=UPI0030FB3C72
MESLFDFDFEPVVISDEEVEEMWSLLQLEMKKEGNYFTERKFIEKLGLQKYQESFVKKGYMTLRHDQYSAVRSHLIYHTLDEILDEFEEKVERFLENPSSDYRGSASFLLELPCDMAPTIDESQKIKGEAYELMKPFSKRIAIELGVDYYTKNILTSDYKMNCFSDKAYKTHFLPFFYDLVIPITDYDEMYDLLKNHSFVVGRNDHFMYGTTPYLKVEKPMFSDLDIAVLCQTTDKKIINHILRRVGKSMGGRSNINDNNFSGLLFAPTFSYQDYVNSLTMDDSVKIFDDIERLNRLHGKKEVA